MAIVFVAVSITLFVIMNSVKEYRIQYYSPFNKSQCDVGKVCTLNFSVQKQMKAPIYFMYEVGNFYQNHRRYIQSKSNSQLAGNTIWGYETEVCWPYKTNQQMGVSTSWGGLQLNKSQIASPCGAIAKTFFNDTFVMFRNNSGTLTSVAINETGIAWPGDQGSKYKRSVNSAAVQWVDPENEHFIVWMRTSGLPNFKKLWGRIQSDLQAGDYTIQVQNNYNSIDWQGKRFVHLTTKTLFGGKNILLPSVFMVLGVGCIVASIFFLKKWKSNKNHIE